MNTAEGNQVLVVCAPGGHLTVAKELFSNVEFRTLFVVTSSRVKLMQSNTNGILIAESNRDAKIIIQFVIAIYIIIRNKPKIVVSTGAGVALPFFIVGKIFGIKLIYVESASRTHTLSLTGKIAYYMVDRFYVRSKNLKNKYKNAIYI